MATLKMNIQVAIRRWLVDKWGISDPIFQIRLIESIPSHCNTTETAMQFLTQYLSLQKLKPISDLGTKLNDYYLKF